uniref:Small ubiquitin like modifier 3a n=1 Tax=Hucho hucho TaxID=62062 RepID=A0A4W5KYL6_9TELE
MKAYCERQVSTVANQTPFPPTCRLNGEDWSRGTLNIAHINIINRADLIPNTRGISVPCISNVSSLLQGLSIRQIRFRFDGQPINETDTPSQLEMEDEDTIDVFQQQTGGLC